MCLSSFRKNKESSQRSLLAWGEVVCYAEARRGGYVCQTA